MPHTELFISSDGGAIEAAIRYAIWNLYQAGVPIINVSWTGTGLNEAAAREITESGTTLVLGAGNDNYASYHSEIADIPGVINVSSINVQNKHVNHYAHNQYVDICAPGSVVATTRANNSYGPSAGTSASAAIVSGVIALMLEVNPCLQPSEVESIIKQTADPIADAHDYPGLLGAGKINAYEAVKLAGTKNINNSSLSGTKIISAGYGFNLANTLIENSSNITLIARKEVNIDGNFEVPLGNSFSIEIDLEIRSSCD